MTPNDRAFRRVRNVPVFRVPVNVMLLAGVGLALVGAGALLSSRSGPFVSFEETVLTVLDWCF
jgi:hypothetical protein